MILGSIWESAPSLCMNYKEMFQSFIIGCHDSYEDLVKLIFHLPVLSFDELEISRRLILLTHSITILHCSNYQMIWC